MSGSSTSEVKDIGLNSLEKRSFYSFLALYIGSSTLFLLLSGFWYYTAQKNMLENSVYYKMQHYSDTIGGLIINAQMHGTTLQLPKLEEGYEYFLVKSQEKQKYQSGYFQNQDANILVSSSPQEHLNVEYVVIKSNEYQNKISFLQHRLIAVISFVFFLIVVISWILSKLFMRPIHEKMVQIEQFIQDISHELNTPITALQMSSKRGLQKGVYDEKILKNISISTKQLYSIYQSLVYLSFSSKKVESQKIDLKNILEDVIEFYSELCFAKNIQISQHIESCFFKIDEQKARLLFSNLLSNAIKYSLPNKKITLTLTCKHFIIEDEGIGIAPQKLNKIFELYERGSQQAGGFGVGLSIVKQICDEAGIVIEVESKLNEGSKFLLDLDSKKSV